MNNLPQAHDAISVAGQIGRLDLVSALMAIVAIVLAASAIPMFFYLRYRAGVAAREEVTERIDEIVKRVEADANSKLQAMLPTLVEEYMELMRNSVTDEVANHIAEAQDEGPDADDFRDHQGGAANG